MREITGDINLDSMWRDLGRQLAALRREAGLTQEALAARMSFSRSAVSTAEVALQAQSPDFWRACDKALKTRGALAAGAAQIHEASKARERAAARAAQEAREALALDAFAAAREKSGVSAGVSGVQSCPNCGCEVAILTTLIPGAVDGAEMQPGSAGISGRRGRHLAQAGTESLNRAAIGGGL